MPSPETGVAPVSTNFGIDSDFRPIFRNSGVADCHVFPLADRNLRLAADDARTAELSSDGARLVYERGDDLFVYELDAQRERRRVACRPSSSGTTRERHPEWMRIAYPNVWVKTAEEILACIARFAQRTLQAHGP